MKKIALLFIFSLFIACSSDDSNAPTSNCANPTNVIVSDVTGFSAKVSWTSTASNFRIEYGPSGFIQSSGTLINTTDNPFTINGLDATTSYDVYVRIDCGTDGLSQWAGPFSFTTTCNGGAFSGNTTLTTQQEVNDFGAQCYTSVTGNFSINQDPITADPITSLTPLVNLVTITGSILIYDNPDLSSLAGLSNLSSAGHLFIKGNTTLTSIQGLNNLTNITSQTGGIVIAENPALNSLLGLENITTTNSWLNVRDNAALTSLDGVNNLTTVNDDVFINNNAQLSDLCALTTLFAAGSVTGNVTISNNAYNPSGQEIGNGNCSL
ncbi:MAG: hypothetical protein HRT68_04280 [Flavobacteriaceae bacterium]|nr:hypothetical protein [Flavobacteriaceae bacterium]